MEQWIDRLAEALGEDALDERETSLLLGAARDVAHRVERKVTPLSTFLAGTAVGRSMAAGAERHHALMAVLDSIASLLPPAPAE